MLAPLVVYMGVRHAGVTSLGRRAAATCASWRNGSLVQVTVSGGVGADAGGAVTVEWSSRRHGTAARVSRTRVPAYPTPSFLSATAARSRRSGATGPREPRHGQRLPARFRRVPVRQRGEGRLGEVRPVDPSVGHRALRSQGTPSPNRVRAMVSFAPASAASCCNTPSCSRLSRATTTPGLIAGRRG